METTTIHPAEAYLRNEQNSTSLYAVSYTHLTLPTKLEV